jgi:hypothetical protein
MNKIIEMLEMEINTLGASWNLFGKVDRMKYLLEKLKKEKINDFEFDANIESVAFTSESNHGILKLKLPYSFYKISNLDKSKSIEVVIKYKT